MQYLIETPVRYSHHTDFGAFGHYTPPSMQARWHSVSQTPAGCSIDYAPVFMELADVASRMGRVISEEVR